MSESTDLVAVEQPQQLITIEPKKYVALVFENHRTRADAYKAEAPTVTYDITTTAGMKTAVEWRAKGRDIRVEVTDIHKERKAPILEIGRLMDARKKEIIADVEPDEDRFDRDIKAETARKEAERQARLAAEAARIAFIRKRIGEIQAIPSESVGRSAADLAATIELTEMLEITLAEFMELSGECEVVKSIALGKLREMHAAQLAAEEAAAEAARQAEAERIERAAEAQRLAVERAQLAKEREEAAERERQAAAERQRIADEERIARAKAQAAMLAEQQAHEARLRAEREAAEAELRKQREVEEARLAEQRAELARQQAAIDAANAERERVEREAREAAEAEARARQEAEEAAALAEAQRIAEAAAAEAERREREARAEVERAALEAEVARLHALHFAHDGLGMLEDVMNEVVRPIGQECCGRPGSECCGCPDPIFHTIDSLATELNKWRDELIQRRAEQKEAA
jgi:chemotaxis protein histidine kinase CheA